MNDTNMVTQQEHGDPHLRERFEAAWTGKFKNQPNIIDSDTLFNIFLDDAALYRLLR